jgi:hypothetical protein
MLSEIFSSIVYRKCRGPKIGWFKAYCRLTEKYEGSTEKHLFNKKGGSFKFWNYF